MESFSSNKINISRVYFYLFKKFILKFKMKIFLIGVVVCLVSLLRILAEKNHILLIFLYIEFFFLGGYLLIKCSLVFLNNQEILLVIYLLIGVIEGVIRLSLLIGYFRSNSEDYIINNLYA
jgi:hypothetical protein